MMWPTNSEAQAYFIACVLAIAATVLFLGCLLASWRTNNRLRAKLRNLRAVHANARRALQRLEQEAWDRNVEPILTVGVPWAGAWQLAPDPVDRHAATEPASWAQPTPIPAPLSPTWAVGPTLHESVVVGDPEATRVIHAADHDGSDTP